MINSKYTVIKINLLKVTFAAFYLKFTLRLGDFVANVLEPSKIPLRLGDFVANVLEPSKIPLRLGDFVANFSNLK
jgi:hypothetical protein